MEIAHNFRKLALAGFMVSLMSAPAAWSQVQDTGLYFGVDVMEVEFQSTGFSNAKPISVGLTTGYRLNEFLAVEARAGTGLSGDDARAGGTPVDVELDSFYGFYARGILPVSDILEIYGAVGYTYADMKVRFPGGSITGSDNDISYGVGAALKLSFSTSLNLEWARMLDGDGFRLDALSLGVRFSF